MIKVENLSVYNFEGAIRGMRNPMASWNRIDSTPCNVPTRQIVTDDGRILTEKTLLCKHCSHSKEGCSITGYWVGHADLDLMNRLFHAGSEHRKFMRQILVSMDITAPEYWWKEFDTYKVGIVRNSTSTMHRLTKSEITKDMFSFENVSDELSASIIKSLEYLRREFIRTGNKYTWKEMIQILPMSFNYKCTVTFDYENAASMILQRSEHKLSEWREFCEVLEGLPYMEKIRKDVNNDGH